MLEATLGREQKGRTTVNQPNERPAWAPPPKKLAQPIEQVTTPLRMVTCAIHSSVHRERITCVRPREGQ